MKFVIDRIEENIVICQRLDNKEMFELGVDKLPSDIKEGSVILESNGKYVIDLNEEKVITKRIEQKMNKLWK